MRLSPRRAVPAALACLLLAVACSSSSGGTNDVASGKDASPDQQTGSCANVGCAPPPPCGQACTAPCGCCAAVCSDASADAGDASDGGTCGITLSFANDTATCDAWMTANCCAEARACASDATCAAWVACVNTCATPRQQACTSACGAIPTAFDGLASCSKRTPPAVSTEIPSSCRWP